MLSSQSATCSGIVAKCGGTTLAALDATLPNLIGVSGAVHARSRGSQVTGRHAPGEWGAGRRTRLRGRRRVPLTSVLELRSRLTQAAAA